VCKVMCLTLMVFIKTIFLPRSYRYVTSSMQGEHLQIAPSHDGVKDEYVLYCDIVRVSVTSEAEAKDCFREPDTTSDSSITLHT
jgi:hypothetical protein